MREKIYNVIKDLQRGNVNYSDAVDKLCDLHSVIYYVQANCSEFNFEFVGMYKTKEMAQKIANLWNSDISSTAYEVRKWEL